MLGYLPPVLPPHRQAAELFDILEVDSWAAGRGLARAPWLVYRDDPYWTPPLLADRRRMVELGRLGRLPVGEAGLLYAESRSLTFANPVTGSLAVWMPTGRDAAFGLLDFVNNPDLAQALVDRGVTWLFEYAGPVRALRGPMSLHPLGLHGLLVDGFGARPGSLLPYNPPYYPEALSTAGFAEARRWDSYVIDLSAAAPRAGAPSDPTIHILSGPDLPWAAVAEQYRGLEELLPPGLLGCLSAPEGGEEAQLLSRQGRFVLQRLMARGLAVTSFGPPGACFALPDAVGAMRWVGGHVIPFGWASFMLELARPRRLHVFPPSLTAADRRHTAHLFSALFAAAGRLGYREATIAPVWEPRSGTEDAAGAEALTALGARVAHRYAIFEKQF